MLKLIIATIQALLLAAALFCPDESRAADSPESLAATIMSLDRVLFEQGFNDCDIEALDGVVSESLEFYHDQGGITRGKTAFLDSVRNNICNIEYKASRELLPGTFSIHPLYENGELYGVIQQGEHRFLAKYPDEPLRVTSVASFTHLWLLDGDEWKLSRVLSYDHHAPASPRPTAGADAI
ncbi:MAG: nuclear transport factor 2 family protein [Gammaproteobacteria bacterium]|nr:nuclear transport factor 2 family protein [Gammaproteobacteria bacterium]